MVRMKKIPGKATLMKRNIFLLIALLFLTATDLYAWGYHTHRKLTAEAFKHMPEAFQQRFQKHKKAFLKGSTDPDTLIMDFQNHIFYPDGRQTGGLYRIQDLFNRSVELLSSSESDEKTAYMMGLMSHYIADLNQPLHTAGSERDPSEGSYHSLHEKDINRNLRRFTFSFFRERQISSIEERVREMTAQAFKEYDAIGISYRAGTGLEPLVPMVEKQLNASLQNIVDFWSAVLRSARFDSNAASRDSSAGTAWNLDNSEVADPEKINVNSASAAELSDFFKINPEKAQLIVDNRPYRTAYDLAKTKVFTPMYIKRNRDRIKLK